MKSSLLGALSLLVACFSLAAPPAFHTASVPDGWTIVRGEADPGVVRSAKAAVPLELKTSTPLALPVEATFRFRAGQGDVVTLNVLNEAKDAKPLLQSVFRVTAPTQAIVTAVASGEPMNTTAPSIRKRSGSLTYSWRFPKVKNLWDEADRKEIGAAYAKLVPLEEKTFTLRLVLTTAGRQIWLDDRLVAEARVASPKEAWFSILLTKSAQVLSADFAKPTDQGRFLPLSFTHHSHAKLAQGAAAETQAASFSDVPFVLHKARVSEINLSDSLDRYRRTHGSGPDASYVNALHAWPDAFKIDPASLTFRVPYRTYANAWLVAWVDETPTAVAKGAFRFFRPDAGYPAATDFEISHETIASGLVTRLPQKTAEGMPLYLVRIPINSEALYGFKDMADAFLDFELTKPLALGRSYPDPIYYGWHPVGPPSSVHVVGITLEEAPFEYEVKPQRTGFVFEQPEPASYAVAVRNTSARPIEAKVTLQSRSHDGEERATVTGSVKLAPGESRDVELKFDLKKLGWHELKAAVEAGGSQQHCTLSMVLLPPNQRTYGTAANETRFGMWPLLGHYTPMSGDPALNEALLAMYRKLGLRRIPPHTMVGTAEMLKRHDFLPTGPHTIAGNTGKTVKPDGSVDADEMKRAVDREVANLNNRVDFPGSTYFYGGEWHISKEIQHGPWPRYTGDGDRPLTVDEQGNAGRHVKIWSAIGNAIRAASPQTRLVLQWGAPNGTIAYMRAGMPKNLVDMYGMDAPQFELIPEISNVTGSINQLWQLRQETEKLGWPKLPINWTEGPFFPTNPGALTEDDQADYQIRYWLLALAYGVDSFESGMVPFDAGNYYGAEHYGAGVFHRTPLACPKPAVAAIATTTAMLCGADPAGSVATGSLTTYCMTFVRAKDQAKVHALWRVTGTAEARLTVSGTTATITDAMGNARQVPVKNGVLVVPLSSSPVWLTGVQQIDKIELGTPAYTSAPAKITRPLTDMAAAKWTYDGAEDKAYAYNHFAIRRIPDPKLTAEFGQGEDAHPDAVAITLPVEPGDRPLATRYGALKLKKPVVIPGKASALGIHIKGNSSWGRVVYQLRDAKGETWTSVGTKDDWNCDDTHAWSYVNFDGWRYVRFPLPGTHPYDTARELETTWWGSRGGDGVVDLPLTLEKIIVEARNEVPWLGEMKVVPERSYKLSQIVAEYESEEHTAPAFFTRYKARMPLPVWTGPVDNFLAKLNVEGTGPAPELREFTEPQHFNDGRRMLVHFNQDPALKYNLYLSIYPDGRGADLLKAGVNSDDQVNGFKPEMAMYLFLTSVGADKKESKPSKALKLITHDNFAEK